MNLIEQLGGYENVSKHFNRVEYHAETKIFIGEWFGFYSMRDLKDSLLEYRRQHNIFEVGDWFVSDAILKPFKIVEEDGDYLKLWSKEHTAEFSGNAETITQIFKNARHATDAEIEVGKRLEIIE